MLQINLVDFDSTFRNHYLIQNQINYFNHDDDPIMNTFNLMEK